MEFFKKILVGLSSAYDYAESVLVLIVAPLRGRVAQTDYPKFTRFDKNWDYG